MTHFHPQSPDYPCPADNDDRPEDLAAYRAVEKAGRMKDGCSTTAAFRIFTAYREALYSNGKFPQGKHWNGPEMKYHVTAADRQAEAERNRTAASAAWAAKAATGDYICPIGHRHLLTPEGWLTIGLFITTGPEWPAGTTAETKAQAKAFAAPIVVHATKSEGGGGLERIPWICPTHAVSEPKTSPKGRHYRSCPKCMEFER